MKELNTLSLTRFAATVADITNVERPACADEPILWLEEAMADLCKEPFDRVFIQNPDCCGQWLFEKYPDAIEPVLKHTQVSVPFQTVMPSVTPVCFGTMYTGAQPAVHGIQKYEKPIIRIESLFDSWMKAGKKVLMVAAEDCSLATIFKDRGFDIVNVIEDGIGQESMAFQIVQEAILEDKYDIIIFYSWMYDTLDHKFGPEAKESLTALYRQAEFFDILVKTIKREWKKHNTFIAFSTDHGCHANVPTPENTDLGDHGTDSPKDLNIVHFFGAIPASK